MQEGHCYPLIRHREGESSAHRVCITVSLQLLHIACDIFPRPHLLYIFQADQGILVNHWQQLRNRHFASLNCSALTFSIFSNFNASSHFVKKTRLKNLGLLVLLVAATDPDSKFVIIWKFIRSMWRNQFAAVVESLAIKAPLEWESRRENKIKWRKREIGIHFETINETHWSSGKHVKNESIQAGLIVFKYVLVEKNQLVYFWIAFWI